MYRKDLSVCLSILLNKNFCVTSWKPEDQAMKYKAILDYAAEVNPNNVWANGSFELCCLNSFEKIFWDIGV